MGFKPIFEEERQFFFEHTGVMLPAECWRSGSKIYLDYTQNKPIVKFRVEEHQIKIVLNNIKSTKQVQVPLQKLIEQNTQSLNSMFENNVKRLYSTIVDHPDYYYIVGNSGGKDSDLIYMMWCSALEMLEMSKKELFEKLNWNINFANTSNDTADTYRKIKKLPQDKLNILNPKVGFYPWVTKVKNYKVPNVLMRNCCSTYKEGQIYKEYDTSKNTIQVLGVRKFESTKRSKYEYWMDGDFIKKYLGKTVCPQHGT